MVVSIFKVRNHIQGKVNERIQHYNPWKGNNHFTFSWPRLDLDIKQRCSSNPQVVENKYQSGVPEREALQDWDLREVVKQI